MLASAEDTILRKLQWFRAVGGAADQQWRDVLGVLRVRRGTLDLAYMKSWSAHIGVSDLLQKAICEARPEDPVGAG